MSTPSSLSPSSLQVPPALFNVFKTRPAATAAGATSPTNVRFVCVSDTHNQLQAHIDAGLIPDGDVFLHAGDFSNKGKPEEVAAFNDALARLPHSVRIVICGNHEDVLSQSHRHSSELRESALPAATHYLQHESVEVHGIKIFGSPFTNFGPAESLKIEKGSALAQKWQDIPSDTDIVMTHMPCGGVLDLAHGPSDGFFRDTAGHDKPPPPPEEWNVPDEVVNGPTRNALMAALRAKAPPKPPAVACDICGLTHPEHSHWGCDDLFRRLHGRSLKELDGSGSVSSTPAHNPSGDEGGGNSGAVQPLVHICGHVHECNGAKMVGRVWHVNAAMDEHPRAIVFDFHLTDGIIQ